MQIDENKKKALELAIKQIDKAFGKGALVRLGDKVVEPIASISTGSIGLDLALGIGGIPQGRIIEIYGPESSGKTTLSLQIIAEAQSKGSICAFVDAEHALDVKYAGNLGVDIENLLVSQPDFGEQALDIVETLARSGAVDVIVVDSVAALTPKSEIEGDMGDSHMGVQIPNGLHFLTRLCFLPATAVISVWKMEITISVIIGFFKNWLDLNMKICISHSHNKSIDTNICFATAAAYSGLSGWMAAV
jgi:recombination protein RecA